MCQPIPTTFSLRISFAPQLYRTEEEKQIFQMMVEGATADEARDHIHQSTQTLRVGVSGEIELF